MTPNDSVEPFEGPRAWLGLLVRISSARPVLTVVLSVVCAIGGVCYSFRNLSFISSGRDLLPRDQAYVRLDAEYGRDFSEIKEIIIAVDAGSLPSAEAYARRLVQELRRYPDRFERVRYRIDPRRFEGRALLYLSTPKLSEIRDKVFDYQGFITSFAARPTLDQLVDNVRAQVVGAFVASALDLGLEAPKTDVDLGFVTDLLGQISTRLDGAAPYQSPWASLLSVDPHAGDDGYFVSDDKRLLFVMVDAAHQRRGFTEDREVIDTLRGTIAGLRAEFPGVRAGVTGAPALENDEMVAAFKGSARATILASVLTLGVLLLAFRRIGSPMLMLMTLAISLCWAMGIITLVVGHLSIFSVMFISIVIGIGIDYGIYFLFRDYEERLLGHGRRQALEVTGIRSGPGMLSGALTAAGTFYVLMATDFRGVSELGFIAGTSILLSWLSMMTLLPALLMLADRRPPIRATATSDRLQVPIIERIASYRKTVLVAAGGVTVLSVLAVPRVHFDYNLLHLQPAGTESVVWENRILATAGRSSFAAVATAGSLPELRRKAEAFGRLQSVSDVDSALLLIPEDQAAKRTILRDIASVVAPVRVAEPHPLDLDRLGVALRALERRFGLAVEEAPVGHDREEVAAVRDRTTALIAKLERTERTVAEPALARLQDQTYRDFQRTFQRLKRNLSPPPVGLDDVPRELRRKFVGSSGRLLLEIYPKVNIWDRKGAETFVADLRTVDFEVTGIPIITFEAIRHMEKAYREGIIYASIVVALITALFVARRREGVLAMLPLVLGTLWTVGLMYVFNLPFNLGNVFGLPLIIGAGAEFGLNVVLRYLEGRENGGPLVARSTVKAVFYNGLTTVSGFGSLMVADHRGIFGLGLLLTLGMIATVTASLVVLPVMLGGAARVTDRRPLSERAIGLGAVRASWLRQKPADTRAAGSTEGPTAPESA